MRVWRAFRRRPLVGDILVATLLAAVGICALFVGHPDSGSRRGNAFAVLLVLLMTLPLVARRRAPVAVLACTAIAAAVFDVADFTPTTGELALLVAFYSVAAHAPQPQRRQAAITFFVLYVAFVATGVAVDNHHRTVGDLIGSAVVFATAFLVGDNIRRRRERVADLEERARRVEHERELEARDAAARERAAIARELHDVVAHSVTVMVVQAAAARRVLAIDPARAEASIRFIEETGRESLVEMRRILGVLRNGDDSPQLQPQPGLGRIDELVRAELATPVELTSRGTARSLPTLVDVSAYRIVQEALTNVRKHAGPARVRVLLDYGDDSLEIRVDDDGLGRSGPVNANGNGTGSGHGLTGMRERAALCGGALDAGPRRDGGWSVIARLPYEKA